MRFSTPCKAAGCVSLAPPGQDFCPVHRPVVKPDLPRYCDGFRRWLHVPSRRVIVLPTAWTRFAFRGQTYAPEERVVLSVAALEDGYRLPSKNWTRA